MHNTLICGKCLVRKGLAVELSHGIDGWFCALHAAPVRAHEILSRPVFTENDGLRRVSTSPDILVDQPLPIDPEDGPIDWPVRYRPLTQSTYIPPINENQITAVGLVLIGTHPDKEFIEDAALESVYCN